MSDLATSKPLSIRIGLILTGSETWQLKHLRQRSEFKITFNYKLREKLTFKAFQLLITAPHKLKQILRLKLLAGLQTLRRRVMSLIT